MKTTIEIPGALLQRAKIAAVRRDTTLKELILEGLERVLSSPANANSGPVSTLPDEQYFERDAYGVPVLRHRGLIVTDEAIEKLRESEGI